MKANLQPYNDAQVNSFQIFVKDGGKAEVRVYGNYVPEGVDVESQGFGQRSAEGKADLNRMSPAKAAEFIFKLSRKMK
jgi:hypothetical protein